MGNVRAWAKALLAAVIGGAASVGAAAIVDPAHFNFGEWRKLLALLGAGGLIAALGYLKQSPLPKDE